MLSPRPTSHARLTLALLGAALLLVPADAAAAPDRIAYLGVLRGSDNSPLAGNHDMVFRFFDAATGGNEILVDSHLAAAGQAVAVTGGLFTVDLGGGTVSDGSGPGAYTGLAAVFAGYADVWLEIRIGAETLAPRLRVLSAPWALQAVDSGRLGGKPASDYLDTSATLQAKTGALVVGAAASATGGTVGVEGSGAGGGGYFRDLDGSASAVVAQGDYGIIASGSGSGAFFQNSSTFDYAELGTTGYGIDALGSVQGARFRTSDPLGSQASLATVDYGFLGFGRHGGGFMRDLDNTASVYLARGDEGINARGTMRGGYFVQDAFSSEAYVADGSTGISANGNLAGGSFSDRDGTGSAFVGTGDTGIRAGGTTAGGYFEDESGTSHAYAGYGGRGIEAEGATTGGYFTTANSSGYAYVGDTGYGVRANGSTAGGQFTDTNGTGNAYLGFGDYGIQGFGSFAGGYFKCNGAGNTGEVWLGDHNRGVWSRGTEYGGFFYDSNGTGQATLGIGDTGLTATGSFEGVNAAGGNWAGYFTDSNDGSEVYLAFGFQGIQARGDTYGGNFVDTNSGSQASVGFSTYKIQGVGTVSFVQNHPDDPSRVIVYHAPESSEVAVYDRGNGRLEGGTARVALDPTFAWVANPDVGLTAHLTPRGASCALHVAALSTAELTVGSDDPGCSDAEFDYMVWGLRIGFEELPPVQPKPHEAMIPSMEDHRALYRSEPGLRAFAAGARFAAAAGKRHEGAVAGSGARAADLLARIGEFDPAVHAVTGTGRPAVEAGRPERPGAAADPAAHGPSGAAAGSSATEVPMLRHAPAPPAATPAAGPAVVPAGGADNGPGGGANRPDRPLFPVSGDVDPGDVLALDPDRPGHLRRAAAMADAAIVGVAAATAVPTASSDITEVEVLGAGFARVNADAGYGSIRPGDLLISSPTPGHAMRAIEIVPGTVLGKAIDGLDTGTGPIRILLLAR